MTDAANSQQADRIITLNPDKNGKSVARITADEIMNRDPRGTTEN
jgi:hypothetical protein